ncbi:hypothetical protein [Pseudoalteromonas sp. GB56]
MKKALLTALKVLLGLTLTLSVVVSVLLFTAPGNKAIAALANKFVDGLEITLPQGRFFNNDPFNIRFNSPMVEFEAQALQLDYTFFGCHGICFDNLAAQQIGLVVLALPPKEQHKQLPDSPEKQPLSLPKVRIQQISIAEINTEVVGNKVRAAQLQGSVNTEAQNIDVDKLSIASVSAQLVQKPKENKAFESLPVLPSIDLNLGLNVRAPEILISEIDVLRGQQKQTLEGLQLALSLVDNVVNIENLNLEYHLPNSEQTAKLDTRAHVALTGDNDS